MAEGPGEIVKGISGEAVRIMRKPGIAVLEKYYMHPSDPTIFTQIMRRSSTTYKNYTMKGIDPLLLFYAIRILSQTTNFKLVGSLAKSGSIMFPSRPSSSQ